MAEIIDQAIARFRTGAAQGITLPRMSVEQMIEQLDLQTGAPIEQSPYWAPVANFDGIDDRTRACAANTAKC